jgi:hypothetical protein
VPEQQVDVQNWTTFAAPTVGTVGQFLQEMAVLASDRQTELGRQVADQLPEWAVEYLGLPPVEPSQRDEWVHRAGVAAAYRELAAVPEDQVSLGAAPSQEQEFWRALWQQAYTALGKPGDALDFAMAEDAELHEVRARWEREQTWAPPYVADEMQAAYTVAEGYRQDAAIYAAQLATMPEGSPAYIATSEDVARAERLAADYAERARQLESIHTARQHWHQTTEDARVRDQLAREELERRGGTERTSQDPVLREVEQLGLFGTATEAEVGPDPEGGKPQRIIDRARENGHQAIDQQLDATQRDLAAATSEHVRWWQQWRDRLINRNHPAGIDNEAATAEPEPVAAEQVFESMQVDAAITQARTVDQERDDLALAQPGREDVDENQLELFTLDVEARVGAQPLRVETQERHHQPEKTVDVDDIEVRVSLAQTRRLARTAELGRARREAAEQARAEERRRAAAQALEADRNRRDQAEERELSAAKAAERAARRGQSESEYQANAAQVELVQTQLEGGGG